MLIQINIIGNKSNRNKSDCIAKHIETRWSSGKGVGLLSSGYRLNSYGMQVVNAYNMSYLTLPRKVHLQLGTW